LKKLRRKGGKTIGVISQEFLTVVTEDEKGRILEIITEWQDIYENLQVGMLLKTILVSPKSDFSVLMTSTESLVPSADMCWIGDYPYLNKDGFEFLLEELSLKRGRVSKMSETTFLLPPENYKENDENA
jgi:hypothetical protein